MSAIRRLILLLVFLPPALACGDETWLGTADVKFRGYSTLHDFDGTVKQVPLKVTVAGEIGERVVSATSKVKVKEMSTADEKRDANMWTMFQQAKYPLIKVEVAGAREGVLHPPGGRPGSMRVMLTIAGSSGAVTATVTNVKESPSAGSFDLAFPVSLKAFKLDPPKAVAGLVRVKDTVDVTAQVELKKESPR